jgi:hypothetical protein
MPYEIKFDMPPAGHAVSASRAEKSVEVQAIEFTSTEDGQHFINREEGFPNDILSMLAPQRQFRPSQIDHMLAVIRVDGSTTVYVNELKLVSTVRVARAIEEGQWVSRDDIVDVAGLDPHVVIPPECGYMFLFSHGWRKALLYDYSPLILDRAPRGTDCVFLFGQAYAHLTFQERFSLSQGDWDALFRAKWFPFVGLSNPTIQDTINHIRAGWGLETIIERVVTEVTERLPALLNGWEAHPVFQSHVEVLRRAVDRYIAKDYLSCAGLLYPRIEGIMRSHYHTSMPPKKPKSGELVDAAVASRISNDHSLLLPHRFSEYLRNVYFAGFAPTATVASVSRNSVAHGIADVAELDEASATIAILVLHQLYYCIDRPANTTQST